MIILLELFGYILLEYLLIIPGGFIRWFFLKITGKNKSLEYCFRNRLSINYGISLGVIILVGVINIFL